MVKR
ncbi:Protein of unknown function [Bacillus cereus]|jgi:hypothetical protein